MLDSSIYYWIVTPWQLICKSGEVDLTGEVAREILLSKFWITALRDGELDLFIIKSQSNRVFIPAPFVEVFFSLPAEGLSSVNCFSE